MKKGVIKIFETPNEIQIVSMVTLDKKEKMSCMKNKRQKIFSLE
jgi:hypothetical protein